MKTIDIEIALVKKFDCRRNLIVPNVSWGFLYDESLGRHYEADLLVVSKAGYVIEIEIKTSKADLIRDKLKKMRHDSNKIKYLYFAVPENIVDVCFEHAPEKAGIIVVRETGMPKKFRQKKCSVLRKPKMIGRYKILESERYQLMRLLCMRIWNLKKKLANEN